MVFVEKSEDVGCGIGIWVRWMFGEVVVEGHGKSLAQEPPGKSGSRTRRARFIVPLQGEGGDDVGGDGFAAAYGVYAFVGFGFQVDFFGGDAQGFGQGFSHLGEMRA